jgi:hypothetical protein
MQNYTKYISIVIRHQEKSIECVGKWICRMVEFKELNERVSRCIECAKINYEFINVLIKNYSKFIHSSIKHCDEKNEEIVPNSIIQLFIHISK